MKVISVEEPPAVKYRLRDQARLDHRDSHRDYRRRALAQEFRLDA